MLSGVSNLLNKKISLIASSITIFFLSSIFEVWEVKMLMFLAASYLISKCLHFSDQNSQGLLISIFSIFIFIYILDILSIKLGLVVIIIFYSGASGYLIFALNNYWIKKNQNHISNIISLDLKLLVLFILFISCIYINSLLSFRDSEVSLDGQFQIVEGQITINSNESLQLVLKLCPGNVKENVIFSEFLNNSLFNTEILDLNACIQILRTYNSTNVGIGMNNLIFKFDFQKSMDKSLRISIVLQS